MKVHVRMGVDGGQRGCTGHGRCAMMAGEFYEVDDDGYSVLRGQTVEVPAGLEDRARYGAKVCPERVIEIQE